MGTDRGQEDEWWTRSPSGTLAGDARRARGLPPLQHRDQCARMVRGLARQGIRHQEITGAKSGGPRSWRAARLPRWIVAAGACSDNETELRNVTNTTSTR